MTTNYMYVHEALELLPLFSDSDISVVLEMFAWNMESFSTSQQQYFVTLISL